MNAVLLLGSMLLFVMLGLPISISIGSASALFLALTKFKPMILIAQRLTLGMDSFVLLAVPLFTLSGYLMEQTGMSKRLVGFAKCLLGNIPGSMGSVAIVCCAVFASLTGSGPATVAAIGAVILPALLDSGYTKSEATGLLAAGGSLGPIIPPSIAMIVYGSITGLSISKMFIGGVIPGLLLALCFIIVNVIIALRKPQNARRNGNREPFSLKATLISFWKALPVLVLPIVVLGGIYSGAFTPTEAAVMCVVYSLLFGFITRELDVKKLLSAMNKTVYTSASIMLIVAASSMFAWILSASRIPASIAEVLVPILKTKTAYMFVLLLFLLLVGCFMETLSSIVILAPVLVPIGLELGVDPLHLGVFFVVTLIAGFITPPFGVDLFTASSISDTPFVEVVKGAMPYLIATLIFLIVLAFFPALSTWLPSFLKG